MADFVTPVLAAIENATNLPCTYDDVTTWDIYGSIGIPTEVGDHIDATVICQPGFCRGLKLYDDARAHIGELREYADIHIVTSPFDSDYWHREREKWLVEELGFKRSDITQTGTKVNVCGDYLVDDKTDTLVKWNARWGSDRRQAIRFNQPWNRGEPWSGLAATGWRHLIDIIKTHREDYVRRSYTR